MEYGSGTTFGGVFPGCAADPSLAVEIEGFEGASPSLDDEEDSEPVDFPGVCDGTGGWATLAGAGGCGVWLGSTFAEGVGCADTGSTITEVFGR